jgi:hypothetical protein
MLAEWEQTRYGVKKVCFQPNGQNEQESVTKGSSYCVVTNTGSGAKGAVIALKPVDGEKEVQRYDLRKVMQRRGR